MGVWGVQCVRLLSPNKTLRAYKVGVKVKSPKVVRQFLRSPYVGQETVFTKITATWELAFTVAFWF